MPQNIYDDAIENVAGAPSPPGAPQPASSSIYEQTFLETTGTDEAKLRTSMRTAVQTTPEKAARAAQLAERTGLPVAVVERNFADIEQRAKVDETEYARLLKTAPKLSTWLAENPTHAAVAQNELPRLRQTEELLTFMGSLRRGVDVSQGSYYGSLEALGEAIGSDRLIAYGREGRRRNQAEAESHGQRSSVSNVRTFGDFAQWAKETIGEQIPIMGPMMAGATAGAAAGSVLPGPGTVIGGFIGAFVPALVFNLGDVQSSIKGREYQGPTSPGLVTKGTVDLYSQPKVKNADGSVSTVDSFSVNIDGKETLLPSVTKDGRHLSQGDAIAEYKRTGQHLGVFDSPASADAYAQALHEDYAAGKFDKGVSSPAAAFIGGSAAAALDVALPGKLGGRLIKVIGLEAAEQVATRFLTKAVTGSIIKRTAAGVAEGVLTEGLTEALQEAIGEVAAAKGTGTAVSADLWAQMVEAGAAGALLGGASSGATSVTEGLHERRMAQAAAAQHSSNVLTALGERLAGSEAATNLPPAVESFLASAVKDGPLSQVYAPIASWTEYWQSKGQDPAAVAAMMTGDPKAYETSLRTGEDLVIPTAKYAAGLAGTEHNAFLAQELRFRPGEMNAREAAAFQESISAEQAGPLGPAVGTPLPTEVIRQKLVSQLEAAGVPSTTASTYAALYESVFANLGERAGVDPLELYNRYGLQVERPGITTDPAAAALPLASGLSSTAAAVDADAPLTVEELSQLERRTGTEGQAPGGGADRRAVPSVAPGGNAAALAEMQAEAAGRQVGGGGGQQTLEALKRDPSLKRRGEALRAQASGAPRAARQGVTAEFLAYGPQGPLYNIKGGENDRSTKGADELRRLGIEIPFTPEDTGDHLSGDELRARILAAAAVDSQAAPGQTAGDVTGADRAGAQPNGERSPSVRRVAQSASPDVYVKPKAGAQRGHVNRETAGQLKTRRLEHYADVFAAVLEAARSIDPAVDENLIRQEFNDRVEFLESADAEYADSGHNPRTLLTAIAKAGGLSLAAEEGTAHQQAGMSGEIRWLKESAGGPFGIFAGVRGVFQKRAVGTAGARTGLSLDDMVRSLSQDPEFSYIEDIGDLLAALEDVARLGDAGKANAANLPGTDELQRRAGINMRARWWLGETEYGQETLARQAPIEKKVDGLEVVIGGKRYAVASLREASEKYSAARDASGAGSRNAPSARVERNGLQLGYIAYNGRIVEGTPQTWTSASTVLFDPIGVVEGQVVDVNGRGEGQARLPGDTGDVRNKEIATPAMDAPFALTAETSKRKSKQETLFQSAADAFAALPSEQLGQESVRALPFPSISDADGDALMAARDRSAEPVRRRVPLNQIIATQRTFTEAVAQEYVATPTDEVPDGLELGGKVYLTGGHHRAVAAWARGEQSINIDVRPVDGEKLAADPTVTGYFQERRGAIRFGADRQFRIELLANADLSTFLHETGHFYLEVFGDIIDKLPPASGTRTLQQMQLAGDYTALLEWMGVAKREDIGKEQHEQFARAFEAYLMEGKAPSIELHSAFARFRAWLVGVYRTVAGLKVRLSDDVRAVMDRLVASDAAIADAQAEAAIVPMFTDARAAGMSEPEFTNYRKSVEDASRKAQETLQAKLLGEVQREQQAEWKRRRAEVEVEVAESVHQLPVYQALYAIQRGTTPDGTPLGGELADPQPVKLSRQAIVRDFGDARLKTLPRPSVYTTEDGMEPSTAAELYGFASADELLLALERAEPMKAVIARETDGRMMQENGSILLDGSLHERAQLALTNDARESVIRAEMRALIGLRRQVTPHVTTAVREAKREAAYERRWLEAEAKLRIAIAEGHKQLEIDALQRDVDELQAKAAGGPAAIAAAIPPQRIIRESARQRVAATKLRDLRPQLFWSAARTAGRAAVDAAARQDFELAIVAQQQQLLNLALYREAQKAVEDSEARVLAAKRLSTPAGRTQLGKAGESYLDQVDGILDRYEFATVSQKVLDRRASLRKWVAALEGDGLPVDLPETLLEEARRINYRELTYTELVGVSDGLAQIVHLARLKTRLLKGQAARDLNEVAGDIADNIKAKTGRRVKRTIDMRLPADERARMVAGFFAAHRKMSSLARELDGFEDGGPMWEHVIRPLNEAGDEEARLNAEATEKLGAIVQEAYPGKEKAGLYVKRFIPAVGESMAKMNAVMVALNWGNDGNRQRIVGGYKWSDGQVQAILDTLDARDWKFVQGVWDFLEGYWPAIAAKQERVVGIAPEKVEATPFDTPHGRMQGGYFPIKYDDRQTARAMQNLDLETASFAKAAAYVKATTRRGHTEARVAKVNMPVRLDFGVLFEHVGQVIHDLSHHEALIDVGRVLGHKSVQDAIYETQGDIVYRQFSSGVRDVAFGDTPARNGFERAINHLRTGATIAGLGWNLVTGALQPLGLTQSMVRIGPKWVGVGLSRWLRSSATMEGSIAWIVDRSPMMKTRFETQQREINEIRNKLGVDTGQLTGWIDEAISKTTFDAVTRADIADSFFYLIQVMQRVADVPTWLGQYEKSMAAGEDEERAYALADQAVLDSQAGGQTKDLAAVQRGGPMQRLWTNFYSIFSATYNLAAESKRSRDLTKPGQVGRVAVDYLLLFVLPATLGYGINAIARGNDDKDPAAGLARTIVSYAMGSILGLRELSGAVQGYFGYEGPAGARFFSSASKFIKQAEQGELDAAFWRSLNEVAGMVFHYPSGQVKRTIEGVVAFADGKAGPMAPLVGPPKEPKK